MLDMSKYMHLFAPAVEWILQCVAHKASVVSFCNIFVVIFGCFQSVLEEVLSLVREKTSSGLVMNALINSFKPEFISNRALEFADIIKECEEGVTSKVKLVF